MSTKKIITLVVFEYHFDILDNLLALMQPLGLHINLFTSSEIINLINLDEKDTTMKLYICDHVDYRPYLRAHQKIMSDSNHILIMTVYTYFRFFAQLSMDVPISLVVHNTHFTFNDEKFLDKDQRVKTMIRTFIRSPLSSTIQAKGELLQNSQSIYFLSKNCLRYAHLNYVPHRPKMKLLPFKYCEDNVGKDRSLRASQFNIIIPGGVNSEARNYDFLINWMKGVHPEIKIRIVFLGNSSNKSCQNIISEIKNSAPKLMEIISFKNYIRQSDYNKWLSRADLLLAPLRDKVSFLGYNEYYGKTKISGSIADAIKYKIPLIIPKFYHIESEYSEIIQKYDDQASFNIAITPQHHLHRPETVALPAFERNKVTADLLDSLMMI